MRNHNLDLEHYASEYGFARESADCALADGLLSGQIQIAGMEALVCLNPTWQEDPFNDPRWQNQFLSLSWLDALRRNSVHSSDAARVWYLYVESWSNAELSSEPKSSRAWTRTVALERMVVLSLGSSLFPALADQEIGLVTETLRIHQDWTFESLRNWLQKGRFDRVSVEQIGALIAVSSITGSSPLLEQTYQMLLKGFDASIDTAGVPIAGSFDEQNRLYKSWLQVLTKARRESLEVESHLKHIERFRDFLAHTIQPNGKPVSRGDRELPVGGLDVENKQLRYVASGGSMGDPPSELVYVSPGGFASGRSGWGETERDFVEETFYSICFGSPGLRGGHNDSGSVTYFADGIAWATEVSPSLKHIVPSIGDRGMHSTASIDSLPPRSRTGMTISHCLLTSKTDDYKFKDDSFAPSRLDRRVVYSRSGEYLLVVDEARSSVEVSLSQTWMIPPEVAVEIDDQLVILRQNGRSAVLQCTSRGRVLIRLEEIMDVSGSVHVATRLLLTSMDAYTDVSSVLSRARDGRATKIEFSRVGSGRAVWVDNSYHQELLVLANRGSVVARYTDEPSAVLAELELSLTLGSGSNIDDNTRRLVVRNEIKRVKNVVRRAGSTPESRSKAIESCLRFSQEQSLDGIRDHGLGACLIDLAADDLTHKLDGNTLVGQLRRSPLIRWGSAPMWHDFYRVPITTSIGLPTDYSGLPGESICSVDLGQLVLPFYISQSKGETLTVVFHGSTDRVRNTLPRFERLRTIRGLDNGPSLYFGDPGLDLDAGIILDWYAGTDEINLHAEIATIVQRYADSYGIKRIVLTGNSGGGFAALQVSTYLENSGVVAFNPQIVIDNYGARMAKPAHLASFGVETVARDSGLSPRMNVLERFRQVGFDRRVFLVQNVGDEHHFIEHFLPFVTEYKESGFGSLLETRTPDSGIGHRLPPPDEYVRLLSAGIEWVGADLLSD